MKCNKNKVPMVRLGDYIERSMVNNSDLKYGAELIEGVNSDGKFGPSKADTSDVDLKPYKIVNDGDFVYNPSRLNIGSIACRTTGMCIVSHLYVVFRLNELGKKCIVPEYLYLFLYRKEFFRLVTYLNFGSQRPEFNFFELSDIKIPLPDIEVQKSVVAAYKGLKNLIETNEALIEPLQNACNAYVVDLKKKYPMKALGPYIQECDERNTDNKLKLKDVRGVSIEKKFIPTKADMDGVSLSSYKVVKPNEFCYVSVTSRNGEKISLALQQEEQLIIVSSSYIVFKTTKNMLPEYLYLLFCRPEFDRYTRFNSWGSARETFDFSEMQRVQIPLPPIEIQKAIVAVYKGLAEAKRIASEAKEELKKICPALVQMAAHSA